MAERAINQKNKAFLNTFAPVSSTLDELIREKLECGKFSLTKTGWTKMVATLVCLASLALFLAQDWKPCVDKPDWLTIVFPVCVGSNIVVQVLFYLIFSCGSTVKFPGKWVTADIISNLICSLAGIVGSTILTAMRIKCKENVSMHNIPGPLGIAGGILSVIGCMAIFLMYRYVDEEEEEEQTPNVQIDPRKSMHV